MTTAFVPIERGVHQGCVLSPTLYNVYAEKISKAVEDKPGISIGGRNINTIRYADYTTVIADSEERLQDLINEIDQTSRSIGLEINTEKTKVMTVTKSSIPVNGNVILHNQQLEQVSKF